MAPTLELKLLPPKEAIDFFRQKGYRIGFSYQDVWQAEHQNAFTVAKAMEMDLLVDIRAEVDAALANGTTLQTFIAALRPNLIKRGWWGQREMVDPVTGEKVLAQLGSPRRLKVIYETNLRTAHAEGQWQRIQAGKDILPYLMYHHTHSPWERPEHAAWDGLVLPVDDPWWPRHYPVKAWGCKCRVIPLGDRQLQRLGAKVGEAPAERYTEYTNTRTGETQQVPAGVDPAFHYPPLARAQALEKTLAEKEARAMEALQAPPAQAMPQFVECRTAKEAAAWAVQNDLADHADYTGVKPEVANAFNRSLFDHLQEFPELRQNQKFVGSCQAQFARWRELEVQRLIDAMIQSNPHLPGVDWRAVAEGYVKPRKVNGDTWAHSWREPKVSGIAVNRKWGADLAAFRQSLQQAVAAGFHPVGCDTIRSVVDHELGHQLDSLLGLSGDADVLMAYTEAKSRGTRREVSGYADKNIREFIAECWAESLNNPEPREFARRIADLVRARYADRFGRV